MGKGKKGKEHKESRKTREGMRNVGKGKLKMRKL